MDSSLYRSDLAYIHNAAFVQLARSAAPEIVSRLRSAAAPIRHVLDLGCGSGPLASALVEAGFEVTGVDVSAELLAISRAGVVRVEFVLGSVYEVALPACDAIVAIGEPLTYHSEPQKADAAVQEFFRRAARVLPAGGLLIFDVIETGEPSLAGKTWAHGEDWAVLAETTEEQSSRSLVRNIETFRRLEGGLYRRGREVHRIRLFDTATLCRQLADCGFSVETAQAYGGTPLAPRRRAFFCSRG